MHKKPQHLFYTIITGLASLFFASFLLLIYYIKPFWKDTNTFLTDALGLNIHWVIVISLITLGLLIHHALAFYKRKNGPSLRPVITIAISSLIWVAMTILLWSELEAPDKTKVVMSFTKSLPFLISALYILTITLLLPRYKFWKDVKIRLAVLALPLAAILLVLVKPEGIRMTSEPYLQNPSEDSITIMWTTNKKAVSWVEYGEDFSLKFYPHEDGLTLINQKIQKVRMTGLEAGTSYPYRVASREILNFLPYSVEFGKTVYSREYSFTTLDKDAETASFLVINDLHERHHYWESISKSIEDNPVDFIVINGDYFNDLNEEYQLITNFIEPISQSFASQIPFYFVRGNHETRGVFARSLKNYIDFPGDKYYYSFEHGPLSVIALDGGEDKDDSSSSFSGLVNFQEYRDVESEWIKESVRREDWIQAPWRISLNHLPFNEFLDVDLEFLSYQKEWTELLAEGNLDLMLSGHTHQWAIHPPSDVIPFPIIIGGHTREGSQDFVVVRVDADQHSMEIKLQDQNGIVFEEYEVK